MKKEKILQTISSHPELFPIALGIALVATTAIINHGAAEIAYTTNIYDSAKIAFKYMNGGF